MRWHFLAALSGLLVAFTTVPFVNAQTSGAWRTLAPMPTARQELATAVLDGNIFVIGGYDTAGRSTNTVEVYHPATNTWTTAQPIPVSNNHNSAAVAAGRLYSFGGVSPATYAYDPARDSWSPVATMNFQHGDTAAVGVLNNKIYVAGGSSGVQCEVYDPGANTWTVLAPMNVSRNHCGGAFIDGRFYVAGGRGSANAPTALEVYDPQTNTWATRAPLPTGRSGVGGAAVGGELFVFGGELPDLHGEVEAYNPQTNTWRSLPPMPAPRHGIWAAVIGNLVYLPGGGAAQGFGATNHSDVFLAGGPGFFNGEVTLSNGVLYLAFPGNGNIFGYYAYLSDPRFIYHFDLGYEYWFDGNDGVGGLYLYDFASDSFFYTSPTFAFPYLYDFKLNAFLYYFPDPDNPQRYTTAPRYFYNFTTGQVIIK